jgi:hypothetical protein
MVYALPMRLTIVRSGVPVYGIVERIVCERCWIDTGHLPLDRRGASANG